eukprot:3514690-Alexandrium_andersonii.AAC.1
MEEGGEWEGPRAARTRPRSHSRSRMARSSRVSPTLPWEAAEAIEVPDSPESFSGVAKRPKQGQGTGLPAATAVPL